MIEGIVPFVPCRMAAFAVSGTVKNHQSPFGHGHPHSGGFPHYSEIYFPEEREKGLYAFTAADFLLGGKAEDQTIRLILQTETGIRQGKGDKGAAVIIASQTI